MAARHEPVVDLEGVEGVGVEAGDVGEVGSCGWADV